MTYTPATGNTLKYLTGITAYPVPLVGSSIPTGLPYTSGTEIASAAGNHLGLYEVDGAGNVVKFVDITLAVSEVGAYAAAPATVALAAASVITMVSPGTFSPVLPGGTTTGSLTDWFPGTADKVTFTVTNSGSAGSTITINGDPYVNGANYTITAAPGTLTIVVTTTEAGKVDAKRTYNVRVDPTY